MESDKNKLANNKNKSKNQENEEEVNTIKLNKKNYKVGTINELEQKNKNLDNSTNNDKKDKLLRNKEALGKSSSDAVEDNKMQVDSDDASEDAEYYTESEGDSEIICDDDYLDKSEDFEEVEGQGPLQQKPKSNGNKNKSNVKTGEAGEKKLKINIWNEEKKINEDEKLEYDNEAYEMLHRAMPEWPCMSVDILLPENFSGAPQNFYSTDKSRFNLSKDTFPYTSYMVAGSQTTGPNGFVYAMKWFNMHKTKYDDDPDKAADSDEEEGTDPYMKFEKAQVTGNINKLQTMKNSYLCGIWSDSPSIEIVDLRSIIEDLEASAQITQEELENNNSNKINTNKNKKRKLNAKNITLKSFKRTNEGYALQWHHALPGVLAAGGQDKKIEIYLPADETCSDWFLNSSNTNNSLGLLKGHKASVEGLAWSPSQNFVLASCSVDKSIRFWDLRSDKSNPPIVIEAAHESDVNCISWNTHCDFMVASGSDDNSFKVWDIRYVSNGPISHIKWHKGPITSIAWDPFDESQLAVSSEDNRLSVWDFSVEPDDNQIFDAQNQEIPQQLIFLHQGQENIKEIKFHPLFKNFIVSTAENGINVFKPGFGDEDSVASDDEDMNIDEAQ